MKIYMFRGKEVKARSKDEVLRKNNIKVTDINLKLVTKISKNKHYDRYRRGIV